MDFNKLSKYLDSVNKRGFLNGSDCSVYRDHINVFRQKNGYSSEEEKTKITYRDLYFLHSAANLVVCAAIVLLFEDGKFKADAPVRKYVPDCGFDGDIKALLQVYSHTLDKEKHRVYHQLVAKTVESTAEISLNDFLKQRIFKPLKMNDSSLSLCDENLKQLTAQYIANGGTEKVRTVMSENEGCLITTVYDYALFAETLCNGGVSKNGFRLLKPESIDMLMNNIIYNETTRDSVFVCVGYNGSFVLIDREKHVTIVFAPHKKVDKKIDVKIYPELRELTYNCLGVDLYSKGYNIFP